MDQSEHRAPRTLSVSDQIRNVAGSLDPGPPANEADFHQKVPAWSQLDAVPVPSAEEADSRGVKILSKGLARPHFAGVYLGGVSSYNGIPFFSDACERWIESRTGSAFAFRKLDTAGPPWQRQHSRQQFSTPVDGSWELPSRSAVETYFSVYCNSAMGLVFPIVNISTFMSTIHQAYDVEQDHWDLDVIGAKACVLSFTSILVLMQGQLDSSTFIDMSQCARKAQWLLPHILMEASSVTLQVCSMQVRIQAMPNHTNDSVTI